MLAQNFKTAAALEITKVEFNALRDVLGMLERGEMKHVSGVKTRSWNERGYQRGDVFCGLFNMIGFAETTHCGTACCIAGTCDLVSGTNFAPRFWGDEPGGLPHELGQLFCPNALTAEQMREILPSQAAIALRNFLTHGEPRWPEALAND